jgi:hypothetical protein
MSRPSPTLPSLPPASSKVKVSLLNTVRENVCARILVGESETNNQQQKLEVNAATQHTVFS